MYLTTIRKPVLLPCRCNYMYYLGISLEGYLPLMLFVHCYLLNMILNLHIFIINYICCITLNCVCIYKCYSLKWLNNVFV